MQKHKRAATGLVSEQSVIISQFKAHSLHTSCRREITAKQVITCSGLRTGHLMIKKSYVYHEGSCGWALPRIWKIHISMIIIMYSIQNPSSQRNLSQTAPFSYTTVLTESTTTGPQGTILSLRLLQPPSLWQQHQHSTLPQEQEVRAG